MLSGRSFLCRRLLLLVLGALPSVRSQTSIRYRAAVVEIGPDAANFTDLKGAWESQMRNVQAIDHWAGEAARQGAQIIVFPEVYLEGYRTTSYGWGHGWSPESLPEARPGVSLCSWEAVVKAHTDRRSVLEAVACVAKHHGILIVTGIADVGPCPSKKNPFNNESWWFSCNTTSGKALLNSMVAIGIDGSLLAKYHKRHLANSRGVPWREPFAQVDEPEVVTFEAHFGVRFGMFICNDGNFGGPIRGILKEGVRDIVFSTAWINTNPFMMATTFQDSFSRAHGVNFLAANTDAGGFGTSGSGIWPADVSAPSVQHFRREWFTTQHVCNSTECWMGVLDVESVSSKSAIPKPLQHPKGAAILGSNGSIEVAFSNLEAGSTRMNASVLGVQCSLEVEVLDGHGAFGLVAFAGVNCLGWYAARCNLIACPGNLSEAACTAALTSCAHMSIDEGDESYNLCMEKMVPTAWVSSGPHLGDVSLRISAPGTNTFFPSAMCHDYSVAEPRSTVSTVYVGDEERILKVTAGACKVAGMYGIGARAQEEHEEVEVPPKRVGTPVVV